VGDEFAGEDDEEDVDNGDGGFEGDLARLSLYASMKACSFVVERPCMVEDILIALDKVLPGVQMCRRR
jgi:hypothetical protein